VADDFHELALERLAGTAPEFGPLGLSNHGPMAAEALGALDRGELAPAWAERYRSRLDPAPGPGRAPEGEGWMDALGRPERFADLVALFTAEIGEVGPEETVAEWVPRLAPGASAAAFHGLLRTAHASRALQAVETPGRLAELAQGLAYWAASYEELPGPPILVGASGVPAALAALPELPADAPSAGLISARVRAVERVATAFESAVVSLAPTSQPLLAADLVAAAGASAYLRNGPAGARIPLLHAVTGPMALELVLPWLGRPDGELLFAYVWQAAAALHTAYAPDRRPLDPTDLLVDSPYPEEVVEAAVASGDEHAIKLAEAALRAQRRTGDPAFPAAALDAATHLGDG
jgi:hypothetical protein